jgi:hypothetical protein
MRRPIQTAFLAFLVLGISVSAALAGGSEVVQINQSRRFPLRGDAATVVVGDPTVADVTMADAHSVIVMGRGYGATQVLVSDHAGHILFASKITVVAPDAGRVTVYRAGNESNFGCDGGRCHQLATVAPDSGGAGGDIVATPTAPTDPFSQMVSSMKNMAKVKTGPQALP